MKTEIVGFRLNELLRDKLDNMSYNLGNDRSKQLTKLVEEAVNDYDASVEFASNCLTHAQEFFDSEDKLKMLEYNKELEYARTMIGHNHPMYHELTVWKKRFENKITS